MIFPARRIRPTAKICPIQTVPVERMRLEAWSTVWRLGNPRVTCVEGIAYLCCMRGSFSLSWCASGYRAANKLTAFHTLCAPWKDRKRVARAHAQLSQLCLAPARRRCKLNLQDLLPISLHATVVYTLDIKGDANSIHIVKYFYRCLETENTLKNIYTNILCKEV